MVNRGHRSDYDGPAAERCERALVTLIGDIGPWSDRVALVGGLAPRYIVNSIYADDNCYQGNPYSGNAAHCQWPMKHRASYMSWEIDVDRTCASLGSTNSYRCGYIFEEYVAGNDVAARIVGQLGDSGSGMKWDYRIDGILVRVGGNSSGNTSVIFETAYMVQTRLGSHFNCASSAAVKQPSQWGNCPVVDA